MVDGSFDYIIKPRDTLYFIGKALGLDFTDIMAANGLTGSLIFPGQKLIIPDIDQAAGMMAENNGQWQRTALRLAPVSVLAGDLELLARAVFAEARGESFEGQVAVAAVILNRLETAGFPKTIREIIYQPRAFTAVDDGQINLEPDQTAYEAARKALEGSDPSEGSLYYWNPDISTSRWIWTRDIIKRIGNHLFGI
jgi:N-acetylmuramoyl-L-alanine amidase